MYRDKQGKYRIECRQAGTSRWDTVTTELPRPGADRTETMDYLRARWPGYAFRFDPRFDPPPSLPKPFISV